MASIWDLVGINGRRKGFQFFFHALIMCVSQNIFFSIAFNIGRV